MPAFPVFPINVNTLSLSLSFFLSLWLSLHFENVSCFVGVIPIGFLVPAFPAFPINVNTSHLTRNLARVECFVSTLMGDTSSNLLSHCFSLSHLFHLKLSQKSALSPRYFFLPHPTHGPPHDNTQDNTIQIQICIFYMRKHLQQRPLSGKIKLKSVTCFRFPLFFATNHVRFLMVRVGRCNKISSG